MWRKIGEIFLLEFAERAYEGELGADGGFGVGIGLVFVFAGACAKERGEPENDEGGKHGEDEEGGRQLAFTKGVAEGARELGAGGQLSEEPEGEEAEDGGDEEHFWDVLFLVVADFVGEDGFQLFFCELLYKGVEEDDAAGLAKACEEGVGVGGAAGAVHYEDGLAGEVCAAGKGVEAFLEGAVGEGGEFVEEGHDEHGADDHHEEHEAHGEEVAPEPPERRGGDEPDQRQEEGIHEEGVDEGAFELIANPEAERGFVETEAGLDLELLPPFPGEVGEGYEGGNDEEDEGLHPEGGAERSRKPIVEGRQYDEPRDEEPGGLPAVGDGAELALGEGVVRGFLVGLLIDDGFEGVRAAGFPLSDVKAVHGGEDLLRQKLQNDERNKEDGKGGHCEK